MFWNKKNLKEKREETLENRIIDLIQLNSSKVNISYNKYYKRLSQDSSFEECWALVIANKESEFCIGYMHNYNHRMQIFLFEDSNPENDIELDLSKALGIKKAAEERIKRDFIKKLFPVDPEVSKMMSDVEEIQDSKEQVDFILKRIQGIRDKY